MNFGWIHHGVAIDAGFNGAAIFAASFARVKKPSRCHSNWPFNEFTGFPELRLNAIVLSGCGVAALAAGAQVQLERFLSSTVDFVDEFKGRNEIRCRGAKQPFKSTLHSSSWKNGFGFPRDWLLLSSPWLSLFSVAEEGQKKLLVMASRGEGKSVEAYGSSSSPSTPSKDRSSSRLVTNCILGLNILVYMAQAASGGELLLWGAKVNSLIDQGQFWRLFTPALLHANLAHLSVNTYSLNSVGPAVEKLGGSRRFAAVYLVSAVSSSAFSYYFCKNPSVGASGAIFGLVGALAVFLARHKDLLSGGKRGLRQVAQVIAINMLFGLSNAGTDNWGHIGGLLGGAALAWLIGPALSFESSTNGERLLVDRPPISRLLHAQKSLKD